VRHLGVWLHLLAAVIWLGGLAFQSHVLFPQLRKGGGGPLAAAALRRFRPVAWSALVLLVLTGFYNFTRLPPLQVLLQSGAGALLALKVVLLLIALPLAAHRDFKLGARLASALEAGEDAASLVRNVAWLDRVVLLLGVILIYLGVALSRGGL
jgi:uncharacterized membrane protein